MSGREIVLAIMTFLLVSGTTFGFVFGLNNYPIETGMILIIGFVILIITYVSYLVYQCLKSIPSVFEWIEKGKEPKK